MIGKKKNVILAGIFGNALEWYDFTVYAFFVPVLAALYFPTKNSFTSLMATFSVFALGFIARPFGGVIFGFIGDQFGRKKALILSMITMSLPTFCLGLLPTYEAIGIAAPIILTLLRLIQGLAVSGELTTATVFLTEHADDKGRGIAGSLAMGSALLGVIMSSALAAIVTWLVSDTQLHAWGFRIPFLIGGAIGIIGLHIRLCSIEPTLYQNHQKNNSLQHRSLLKHLTSLNYRIIIAAILLTSIMGVGNYFLIGYFNTFLTQSMGFSIRDVMLINFIALTVQMILTLLMGKLSDLIGRKKVLILGMIGFIIFSHLIFWCLTQHNIYLALCGELLFALTLAPLSGVVPPTLAELFDTHHRNIGISLSYNVSLALFGGTAPLIAISLVAYTHNNFAPAWYIICVALVALITAFFIKDHYQVPLATARYRA